MFRCFGHDDDIGANELEWGSNVDSLRVCVCALLFGCVGVVI